MWNIALLFRQRGTHWFTQRRRERRGFYPIQREPLPRHAELVSASIQRMPLPPLEQRNRTASDTRLHPHHSPATPRIMDADLHQHDKRGGRNKNLRASAPPREPLSPPAKTPVHHKEKTRRKCNPTTSYTTFKKSRNSAPFPCEVV